jgi:ribosomal-protein-alanine N-acetyltransferase
MGISLDALVGAPRRRSASITFEPMRAEDLDAVMEIERRSFPEPWTPGLFLHELKVPFSKTSVARYGDEIVGYICRWLVGDEVHILNVAVCPEARQSGIGRALVELVMQEAGQASASVITLEVRRENAAAIALYRSFGFTERGVRRNYYARGEDAIIMSRMLRELPPDGTSHNTAV